MSMQKEADECGFYQEMHSSHYVYTGEVSNISIAVSR